MKAQQLSRVHLGTAGHFTKDNKGTSIDWTLGDIFSETILSKSHLTGGFQQGALVPTEEGRQRKVVDSSSETSKGNPQQDYIQRKTNSRITIFPNPTAEQLYINLPGTTQGTIRVFNNAGQLIIQQKIDPNTSEQLEIHQVKNLSSGMYFLHLYQQKQKIHSQSFIKM